MRIYDYRNTGKYMDQLTVMADTLNEEESRQTLDAIEQIRQENKKLKKKRFSEWFDVAILPVLKDFARQERAILKVDRPE